MDDPEPDFAQFCRIEDMQAASEAEGWSIEYRQLQAGSLRVATSSTQCIDVGFLDEFSSRRLEIAGSTPVDHITLMVLASAPAIWINGQTIDSRHILCLPSGADTHLVTEPNVRCLSAHVPIELLQRMRLETCATWARLIDGKTTSIEPGVESNALVQQLMKGSPHTRSTDHERANRVSGLITNVDALFRRASRHPLRSDRRAAIRGRHTIERARDYIEMNIGDPIRMDDVCFRAGVSISTLERTFRRELGLSPSRYIRARRLAAVNRELKRGDPHYTQVGEVALKYGFSHQGRFAGVYSAQFGELPSETLRSR